MLILERRIDERVFIDTTDGRIEVMVTEIKGAAVKIVISAPVNVSIIRDNAKNTAPRERE